jgi:predicted sugar kinase
MNGPQGTPGSNDANGRETTIVTLDDFAAWLLALLYSPGEHDGSVERRFVREQLRHVANAALQQAAQTILKKYGPSWAGVAQEILKLRTAEPAESIFGDVSTPGMGSVLVLYPEASS